MNRLIIAIMLTISFSVSTAGWPTIDLAAIAQMTTEAAKEAKRFIKQMKEAKSRLNELKSQGDHYKDMVEGHYNFEDILNDPYLNEFMALDDWKDIYNDVSDIQDLRTEFGMFSNDPLVQRRYDHELRQYNFQNKVYKSSVKRNEKMKSLLSMFSTATTPAAKEDIANTIRFEQTQMQNDNLMIASMNLQMEKQKNLEMGAAARESTRMLLNEGFPRSR